MHKLVNIVCIFQYCPLWLLDLWHTDKFICLKIPYLINLWECFNPFLLMVEMFETNRAFVIWGLNIFFIVAGYIFTWTWRHWVRELTILFSLTQKFYVRWVVVVWKSWIRKCQGQSILTAVIVGIYLETWVHSLHIGHLYSTSSRRTLPQLYGFHTSRLYMCEEGWLHFFKL